MDCKDLKCSERTKNCRCFAYANVKDPKKEQFCGYKKNSVVIPCDPGCCDGGCPGQCKGVADKPPYEIAQNDVDLSKIPLYLKLAAFLLVVLVIISTISA